MRALALIVTALLLGVPFALTIAAYAAWSGPPPDPDAAPLPAATGVRAFLWEWIATAMLLVTRPFALRDERRDAPGAIIFVPEARLSAAGFWLLRRRLRCLGWSSAGAVQAGLDDLGAACAAVDAAVARIASPAAPLVLVGHGIGGLVARHYAERLAPGRVRCVVTLGTPHQGSTAAPYRLLGARLDRAFVSLVAGRPALVEVVSVSGDYDAWLTPFDDAYCPDGFNITVRGLGHGVLLLSSRVAELIIENLAAPRSAGGAGIGPGDAPK